MQTYQTPIIPGFNPDPSAVHVGTDYSLVTSSFESTPGIPIHHSRDLIPWTRSRGVIQSTYEKPHLSSSPPLQDLAVHICTLDIASGHSTSPSTLLSESSSGVSEGSHLLKRNGK